MPYAWLHLQRLLGARTMELSDSLSDHMRRHSLSSPKPSESFQLTEHLAVMELPYLVIEYVESTTLPGLDCHPCLPLLQ